MIANRVMMWVCAGMAVALVVMFWRANSISNDRDRYRDALSSERAQHGVTRASLGILESELGNMVREGVLREDRLERALAVQAGRTESLQREADLIRQIGGNIECRTPDAIMRSGGL